MSFRLCIIVDRYFRAAPFLPRAWEWRKSSRCSWRATRGSRSRRRDTWEWSCFGWRARMNWQKNCWKRLTPLESSIVCQRLSRGSMLLGKSHCVTGCLWIGEYFFLHFARWLSDLLREVGLYCICNPTSSYLLPFTCLFCFLIHYPYSICHELHMNLP